MRSAILHGTGLNDARGELFFEVLRFIAAHRPPALLLENVPHLLKIDEGAALKTILAEVRGRTGHDCGIALHVFEYLPCYAFG